MSAATASADILIVGAGHNGLICAAYLAKAGLKVTIIESASEVGGGCCTKEVTLPGFKHNLCSVVHTTIPLGPPIKELELERYGLKYLYPEYPRATIFRNGSSLLMRRDPEAMSREIERYSTKDAKTFRKVYSNYKEFMELVYVPWMYSPPVPPSVQEAELEKTEVGRALLQWQATSAYNLYNELFESDEVKTHFLSRFTVLGFAPDDYGLGMPALFRIIHADAPVCMGGSRMLTVALARALKNYSGKVIVNARVSGIIVKRNRAIGVVLADGRKLYAKRAVVSSLQPKKTFMDLVGPEFFEGDFVRKVKAYHSNGRSLFGLHLALAEAPKYAAAGKRPEVNMVFSQEMFGDSMDEQIEVYAEIKLGQLPDREALQVLVPTLVDPSQAPKNKHTSVVWQYAPFRLSEGNELAWETKKVDYSEEVLSLWRRYVINMDGGTVLGIHIRDPLTTYRYNENFVNGVDVVGDLTPDQFGYFRPIAGYNYRTPLSGLYLCGGSSHPSGGVTGAPGYNAANVILSDVGQFAK